MVLSPNIYELPIVWLNTQLVSFIHTTVNNRHALPLCGFTCTSIGNYTVRIYH